MYEQVKKKTPGTEYSFVSDLCEMEHYMENVYIWELAMAVIQLHFHLIKCLSGCWI
jgi:hypothetical protein